MTDELFWHIARNGDNDMDDYGDDAYQRGIDALPRNFTKMLPEHLRAEWTAIKQTIKRKSHHRLEIHPVTISIEWWSTQHYASFEHFMTKIRQDEDAAQRRRAEAAQFQKPEWDAEDLRRVGITLVRK